MAPNLTGDTPLHAAVYSMLANPVRCELVQELLTHPGCIIDAGPVGGWTRELARPHGGAP